MGTLAPEQTVDVFDLAETLPIVSVDVMELWRGATMRAIHAGHPAYDVFFVELAIRLRTVVASFDGKLRRRFPEYVKRPEDIG